MQYNSNDNLSFVATSFGHIDFLDDGALSSFVEVSFFSIVYKVILNTYQKHPLISRFSISVKCPITTIVRSYIANSQLDNLLPYSKVCTLTIQYLGSWIVFGYFHLTLPTFHIQALWENAALLTTSLLLHGCL